MSLFPAILSTIFVLIVVLTFYFVLKEEIRITEYENKKYKKKVREDTEKYKRLKKDAITFKHTPHTVKRSEPSRGNHNDATNSHIYTAHNHSYTSGSTCGDSSSSYSSSSSSSCD